MTENFLHVCWTIDCESSHPALSDAALGRNAMVGFRDLLNDAGWRGSFFLIPEELEPLGDLAGCLGEQGHEIGIHPHPSASGWPNDYLGTYALPHQVEILRAGLQRFHARLGVTPVSCRPGYCSANDSTFEAMESCGILQASASMPGRRMTKLASVWAGAPLFAHAAHRYNRLLEGEMNLIEVPISVDWESMIWGGAHPLDLRVELTDAKNHSFLIEKVIKRQVDEKLPFKAIVILTHNIFRYADQDDFRRQTMLGMINAINRLALRFGLTTKGCSIAVAAEAYRATLSEESRANTKQAKAKD